jgi:hypothetical protein
MRKVFNSILVLTALFTSEVYSQNFAPIGATWHYEISENSPASNYSKWEVVSDSIILGQSTRRIEHTVGSNGMVHEEFMLVYENSSIVYKYHSISNSFTILYDFNAVAGDTWITKFDTCEVLISVDSTSMTLINGFNLKVLHISNGYMETITEKIGNSQRPLQNVDWNCYNSPVDGAYYHGLRCYSDNIIGSYSTGVSATCTSISTSVIETENDISFSIFPNPAKNSIQIDLKNLSNDTFTLYNSTGKSIYTIKLISKSTKIDVSNYTKGIYFYTISNSNKLSSGKLVIQ